MAQRLSTIKYYAHLLRKAEKYPMLGCKRLESVFYGSDRELLPLMFSFYAPKAARIVNVACNRRRAWKGNNLVVAHYDIDPSVLPDIVCSWDDLPDAAHSVDVLVYDPPHLPLAAASKKSKTQMVKAYGLARSVSGDNISSLHGGFLQEARRVLKFDGIVFAKIKDYIHNHRYQWCLIDFIQQAQLIGFTACDLIVKRDPCGGNLKSGRWVNSYHAKNCHCYWVVLRNSLRCETTR